MAYVSEFVIFWIYSGLILYPTDEGQLLSGWKIYLFIWAKAD